VIQTQSPNHKLACEFGALLWIRPAGRFQKGCKPLPKGFSEANPPKPMSACEFGALGLDQAGRPLSKRL